MNPHQAHPASLTAVFTSFWRNRELILQMTKREVIGRYRGSVFGILWSFFNPLLMLAVYTFVFSVAFKARWHMDTSAGTDGSIGGKTEFAIILFAGLIAYGLFAECVNRASSLVLSNVNYVKKVVFPLEILPWISIGAALCHAIISLSVLLLFYLVLNHNLHWTAVLAPLILLPLVLFTVGLAWFLSALGVYLRDVGQTVGLVTTALIFVSPVFYPVTALPENYRFLLMLNPLSYPIEELRHVLIFGKLPDWPTLSVYTLGGVGVAWLGFVFFQKSRKGFADVL